MDYLFVLATSLMLSVWHEAPIQCFEDVCTPAYVMPYDTFATKYDQPLYWIDEVYLEWEIPNTPDHYVSSLVYFDLWPEEDCFMHPSGAPVSICD